MISLEHRQHIVDLIDEAVASGARSLSACEEAGIAPCTYRRWQDKGQVVEDQRPIAKRPHPPNKLSPQEREQLLSVFHWPVFQSLPPSQVVPALADEGLSLLRSRPATGCYTTRSSNMTEAGHASGSGGQSLPNTSPLARIKPGAEMSRG